MENTTHSPLEREVSLNRLISLAAEDIHLEDFFQMVLNEVLSLTWLNILEKGGIFLEKEGALHMIVQRGLQDSIAKACQKVEMGQCLCGIAAQKKEVVYKGQMDCDHTTVVDNMQDHGHYIIPILNKKELQGILVLYLEHGHEQNPDEEAFLKSVANILSLVITRQKRQEILIDQKSKILNASKLSSMGEMAAGIAHEINNPLTIISGYSKILNLMFTENNIDVGNALHLTDKIIDTTTRISKIVAGLRNLSRDADNDPFKIEYVADIVIETLEFCEEKFKKNGLNVDISNVSPHIQINCRKIQISQVLLNLLNNASDATEDYPERWVKIETETNEEYNILRITNSGNKIPDEVQKKMFQPFYTTKELGKGTGLGLSISNNILKEHSGSIVLDLNYQNTSFLLKFPRIEKGN